MGALEVTGEILLLVLKSGMASEDALLLVGGPVSGSVTGVDATGDCANDLTSGWVWLGNFGGC